MEHSVQNATIRSIWRYPVKSMGGEKLSEATIATDGLAGDRAYALVDEPDVRVASAKLPRKWGRLLHLRARYASPDNSVTGRSRVQITFPDGEVRMSDDARIDDALSEFVGRRVRLTSQRPGTVSVERLDPLSVEELVVDIGELMPGSVRGLRAPPRRHHREPERTAEARSRRHRRREEISPQSGSRHRRCVRVCGERLVGKDHRHRRPRSPDIGSDAAMLGSNSQPGGHEPGPERP